MLSAEQNLESADSLLIILEKWEINAWSRFFRIAAFPEELLSTTLAGDKYLLLFPNIVRLVLEKHSSFWKIKTSFFLAYLN